MRPRETVPITTVGSKWAVPPRFHQAVSFYVPRRVRIVAVAGALVLAACGGETLAVEATSPSTPDSTTAASTPETDPAGTTTTEPQPDVPDVDTSQHSVPLDDVLFDTFDGNTVPLPDSTSELRERLLDAIPPIDEPVYEGVDGGDWLLGEDLVLGYVAAEQAYAYPFKILNFHEIVNDTLDGVPVLVSYCPLCRSGIVYDRRIGDDVLEFGNTSALYESDLVMVDRGTGSYWWQVAGEAIVGPLTGTELTPLPSRVARWDDWQLLHPDTKILSRDTGFSRPYENDIFTSYPDLIDQGQFPFPVGEGADDDRLAASNMVVGVEVGGVDRVYPLPIVDGVINDSVAGTPVVVLSAGDGGTADVFSPMVDGVTLDFDRTDDGFVDDQTGSLWSPTGVAIEGPMEGQSLIAIPSRTTFWFAYIAAFPEAQLYTG